MNSGALRAILAVFGHVIKNTHKMGQNTQKKYCHVTSNKGHVMLISDPSSSPGLRRSSARSTELSARSMSFFRSTEHDDCNRGNSGGVRSSQLRRSQNFRSAEHRPKSRGAPRSSSPDSVLRGFTTCASLILTKAVSPKRFEVGVRQLMLGDASDQPMGNGQMAMSQ